jgi:hypothetical protein
MSAACDSKREDTTFPDVEGTVPRPSTLSTHDDSKTIHEWNGRRVGGWSEGCTLCFPDPTRVLASGRSWDVGTAAMDPFTGSYAR